MEFPFIKGMTHRNGEPSSKKFWYNGACAVACIIMLYLGYTLPTDKGMEDWIFVCLFGVFMLTVGGFDVVLEMMKLIIQFKNGPAPTATQPQTPPTTTTK